MRVADSFGFDWIARHAQDLCVEVPVVRTEGRCVYLTRVAKRRLGKSYVEKRLLFRTAPFSAFPTEKEHARKLAGKKLLADLYSCHGSISLGSGRAVLHDGYQLKGVGRTQLAGVHDYYKDSSGASTLFASLVEAAHTEMLRRILTFGALGCDFVCLLGSPPERTSGEPRTIYGRRGSPVRLTHLEHLRGSLSRYGRAKREAKWTLIALELLRAAAPVPKRFDLDDLVRAGRALLDRALVLTAEARVFGLEIAFWGDNYDVFARAFDVGDTDCHFPRIPLRSELRRPRASVPPARFFSELEVLPDPERSFDFSLSPVRNALAALEILLTGAGLPLRDFDRAFDWALVDRSWEAALAHVRTRAPRLLGRASFARRLELPLVHRGRAPSTEVDVEDLLGAPARGIVGSIGHGRLNAFRRRLRKTTAEAIGGPALRGERVPLWDERDLLSLLG